MIPWNNSGECKLYEGDYKIMTFQCFKCSRSIKSCVSGHCQEDHPNEKRARNGCPLSRGWGVKHYPRVFHFPFHHKTLIVILGPWNMLMGAGVTQWGLIFGLKTKDSKIKTKCRGERRSAAFWTMIKKTNLLVLVGFSYKSGNILVTLPLKNLPGSFLARNWHPKWMNSISRAPTAERSLDCEYIKYLVTWKWNMKLFECASI